VIATIDGAIADIKLKYLSNGDIGFVVWGKADHHGNLVNEKQAKKPPHTSKLYDNLMVRHWDAFKTSLHNTLFYGVLTKPEHERVPVLKSFDNLLAGTKLQSPIPPFPSSDFYDISETGVIFVAKDPELNDATHTKSDLYFVATSTNALITDIGHQPPMKLMTANEIAGAASSPVFSPDGRSAAFLKMTEDGYEADRNLVIYAPDIAALCIGARSSSCSVGCSQRCSMHNASQFLRVMGAGNARGAWDISPSKLSFGVNPNDLFLLAEQEAVVSLFHVDVSSQKLQRLSFKEPWLRSISDIVPLSNPERLFISGSSLVDNSYYGLIDLANPHEAHLLSSSSRKGQAFGLHRDQVDSFYYESENGRLVHALVMRPSDFDETKKYPLAMLIHGGPQGAWDEAWSTRWNPAIWAEQGYIVVMPNITGSTGYGQDFTDAIKDNWGGGPYEDIVKCWEHLEANVPYVDLDRAIAAGASYGGYMMYWIQGQPLGRKFKALIAHDGVFNAVGAQMSGDELWFPFHDFNGTLWGNRKSWLKYDPSAHTAAWDTPMLVIHNGKDYRLSIAEGLAAFNVLQVKGVPSRFLTAPDENHWTLKEENSRVWHTVVLNWANKYAGLTPYREDERTIIEPDEPFV